MEDSALKQSLQKIKAALVATEKKQITGALLGELIRDFGNGLNVREVTGVVKGPGAVSKFVEEHLSDVLAQVGSQGSDRVYEIKGSPVRRDDSLNPGPQLWLTFVRPRAVEKILYSAITETVEVIPAEQAASTGRLVHNASSQELDQIRGKFSQLLVSENVTDAEAFNIQLPYADWSSALKKMGREQYKRWTEFRVEKISELFAARLANLGAGALVQEKLCTELLQSQSSAHLASMATRFQPTPLSATVHSPPMASRSETSLLNAIITAIKHLAESELRELKLPAGVLFDALTGNSGSK